MFSSIHRFFQKTIWNDPPPLNIFSAFFYKFLRVTIRSTHGFIKDECFAKASALTYYSLLAIIPLFAIGFGIAQLFGFEETLKKEILLAFQEQPMIAEKAIEFASAALKQTKGGLIASLGLVVLLWTVFSMITSMEAFFDKIWHVSSSRSFLRQTMRYIPLILLLPLFAILAGSSILYISSLGIAQSENPSFSAFIGSATDVLLRIIPYILAWFVFTFLYMYIPHAKVGWKGGIIAGFIASLAFETWQWIYIHFQLKASSFGVIYGSFAAVPLFLIWLNYSWLIVLFGTELSYNIEKDQRKQH